MEAVRQVVDSSSLSGIISLPAFFRDKKVEVVVYLKEDKAKLPVLSERDVDAMLAGSVTESLIGALL